MLLIPAFICLLLKPHGLQGEQRCAKKQFLWQGNGEDFATNSLGEVNKYIKKENPRIPDDFQPSLFEKLLKQSPQEGSAEPCDHSQGM